MKNLFNLFAILFVMNGFSQTFDESASMSSKPPFKNVNGTDSYKNYVGNSGEWSKVMGVLAQFDDIDLEKRNIKGSVYLFKKWENKGEIIVGKKIYVVNNINYHIEKEAFMSKIDKDSTFILHKNMFNKILVNGRLFKYLEMPGKVSTKLYEVMYEGESISLLKDFSISFIERSKNPMVNRPQSELKQKSNYSALKKGKLIPFKLKKSNIKYLVEKNKIDDLKVFIKKHNLRFNKEADLKVIFKYCDNL